MKFGKKCIFKFDSVFLKTVDYLYEESRINCHEIWRVVIQGGKISPIIFNQAYDHINNLIEKKGLLQGQIRKRFLLRSLKKTCLSFSGITERKKSWGKPTKIWICRSMNPRSKWCLITRSRRKLRTYLGAIILEA